MCCVVFDGYHGPSTKDHEHLRRSTAKRSADITVTGLSRCHNDQAAFLSNTSNKMQFIKLLSDYMQSKGHATKCSTSDADTLIVSTALGYARNNRSVVVVAEDTDIFVMLIHHWKTTMADIYMRKENKQSLKAAEVHSICEAHAVMDPVVRFNILFIHA